MNWRRLGSIDIGCPISEGPGGVGPYTTSTYAWEN
jgi:hypothetical protein